MYSSKKTKFLNILCIILALSPGLIRLTRHHFPNVSSNSLICVLYITAVLIWLTQLRLRLLRKEERSYLIFAALLIVFLMVIRTTKYIFIPENTPAARYIWLSLPMICTSWHSVFPAAFPIGWNMSLIHTDLFILLP